MIDLPRQRYAFLALAAAALFGASTPFAKLLIGELPPLALAGLLYLGSGLGLLVAALLFGEAVGGRVWAAAALMLAGASVLSWDPQAELKFSLPVLAIVGACLCWALDNNFTRRISAGDPVVLAMIKGLAAGSFNLALAFALGFRPAGAAALAGALGVGFLGYGVSLVLFIFALRHLGAACTAAHFSTAPFIGATIAIFGLGEPITISFAIALGLMLAATWLVLTERHEHEHAHEYLAHSHRHVHDEHHQHAHRGDEGPEPHTHWHEHPPMTHSHPHLPDLHHRHKH